MMTVSVALVDEQPLVLDALTQLFTTHPSYTVAARGASLEEALAIAGAERPQVMVVDLAQPGATIEAIAKLSAQHPHTDIIAFTAAGGVDHAVRALEAGAKGYVSKTCTADELLRAVEAVRKGETHVSHNFAAGVITALRNASVRKVAAQAIRLSVREDQIVKLLLQGKKNREIASQLEISEKTVKHYMTVLMQKLNARNRVEVVLAAHEFNRTRIGYHAHAGAPN
jgi:two-component system, NarL family, nitrate/nitrite response regulator NarL